MRKSVSSIVYVTHIKQEMEKICNLVACLQEGEIVKLGTLKALMEFSKPYSSLKNKF